MVAVQNAQRVSEASFLEKTSTVATPIDPDIFRVLARAIDLLAIGGRQKIDLDLDGDANLALRQSGSNRDPGGVIGERGDDPAVEMAEELQEIVTPRQRHLGGTRLDFDDAEAGGAGKALGVDRRGEPRWIELVFVHAGIRTGKDSIPRTKLE